MDETLRQLVTLGKEYYQKRDYTAARGLLEQVLEQSHAFADVYNMLGVIYHQAGQFTKAEASFSQALTLNPAYTEAALNLAILFNDIGKYTEAKDAYARALAAKRGADDELDSHVAGKIANMHADVGEAYRAAGRLDAAVIEYRKALALCPSFVDIRVKLASALRELGDPALAIDELMQALAERPRYHPARIQLGLCLYTSGHPREAAATWNEVLTADPSNAIAAMYIKLIGGSGF